MPGREVPDAVLPGGRIVRPEGKAILLSAAAHLGLALILLWAGAFTPAGRGPIMVDLTLPEEAGIAPFSAGTAGAARGVPPVPLSGDAREAAAAVAASPASEAPPPSAEEAGETGVRRITADEAPAVASPAVRPATASNAAGPAPAVPVAAPEVSAAGKDAGDTGRFPGGAGGLPRVADAAGGNADARPGDGPGGPAAPGTVWAHGMGPLFYHIRASIQKSLSYPQMARRMGWQGQVLVTFVVLTDGRVRDLRVVRSSGYPLLDRNALDAIRSAQPFEPRPPFEAQIVTPVVYTLN